MNPCIENYLSERVRPTTSAQMHQQWKHLIFLHQRIPADLLRPLIPTELELDTFDGDTWIGFVPFEMHKIRPWKAERPSLANFFYETNIRTYVHYQGQPGVWFHSLDASHWIGCAVARMMFGLPYVHSKLHGSLNRNGLVYSGSRKGLRLPTIPTTPVDMGEYTVAGEPQGKLTVAQPGSFEFWLLERYALFSVNRHRNLVKANVWHEPYTFQRFSLETASVQNCPLFSAPQEWESALYSPGVDVQTFSARVISPLAGN